MSGKQQKILWPAVFVILTLAGGLVILAARTRATSAKEVGNQWTSVESKTLPPAPAVFQGSRRVSRNLSLQPEAFKLSRRLGRRFESLSRPVSVVSGMLITDSERQPIQIARRQNDRGERVEIATGSGPASLSWSEEDGPRAMSRAADETQRALIERLAFDSADQFVLAQLRGASYYTVARNVMPAEAGGADNYSGPTWDIVRVDDPGGDEQRRPRSKWRLYYINSRTGLIDKVISEVNGQRVETKFSGWSDQAGEKFPTRITWTRSGQTVMELRISSFAYDPQ